MERTEDMIRFTARHQGPKVIPSLPIFTRLVNHAHLRNNICVRDIEANVSVTQRQLLTDILYLRNCIQNSPGIGIGEPLYDGSEVYVALLGPSGYEFAVGFLAIVASGAVCVPLSTAYPLKEMNYFIRKARITYMLVHHDYVKIAIGLQQYMRETFDADLQYICLRDGLFQPPLPLGDIVISSDPEPNANSAGLVIFTSGTTGPPKGTVLRRSAFGSGIQNIIDLYSIESSDAVMHCLPVHHATGILVTFLPFIMAGGCVEFHRKFDEAKSWERWAKGGLKYFSGVPTMYARLMAFHEQSITAPEMAPKSCFVQAAAGFKGFLCGTSSPNARLREKWQQLTGKRLIERYGASETGILYSIPLYDNFKTPIGSVGKIVPGIDVKLSNGREGEVLVRRHDMLSKYLFDPDATRNAFNQDGYFKTGDIARSDGDYYYILGRKSMDILKSGGYKISALDVEAEILHQEYVEEAVVVGVEDEEYGQRVAAAVVLSKDLDLTIDRLRDDLSQKLARYKLPTVLRIVQQMPKTPTGKISKVKVAEEYFGAAQQGSLQVWHPRRLNSRL